MSRRIVVGLALSMIALLAACGSSKDASSKKAPGPPRSSLTGLVVADASVLKRPVLAIKVENSRPARPQSGLQYADIVYEELAEGGITRFVALYQSQDAKLVGPVRSARLVDADILLEYNAMLAYSGAHHVVQDYLKKSGIVLLSHGKIGAPVFYRSKNRFAPHNLYTSTTGLWRAKDASLGEPPPTDLFRFVEQPPLLPSPPPSGSTVEPSPSSVSRGPSLAIPFSGQQTSIWKYDTTLDRYLRWQGSRKHVLDDGGQVQARNVLVLFVRVGETRIVDAAGHNSPDVVVIGSGTLRLYRNGLRIDGRWSRNGPEGRTKMTDLQGRPLALAPGPTWVELVPTDVAVGA